MLDALTEQWRDYVAESDPENLDLSASELYADFLLYLEISADERIGDAAEALAQLRAMEVSDFQRFMLQDLEDHDN